MLVLRNGDAIAGRGRRGYSAPFARGIPEEAVMHKLGNLIISGTEVYTLPQLPAAHTRLEDREAAPRRRTALRELLLHTLAAGALPLPGRKG